MTVALKECFVPRKRQERGERRIVAIVSAAARLSANYGFDGTSMNHVARESGLSIGSMNQYFPGKNAIVDAVADDYVRAWQKNMNATLFTDAPVTLGRVYISGSPRWSISTDVTPASRPSSTQIRGGLRPSGPFKKVSTSPSHSFRDLSARGTGRNRPDRLHRRNDDA